MLEEDSAGLREFGGCVLLAVGDLVMWGDLVSFQGDMERIGSLGELVSRELLELLHLWPLTGGEEGLTLLSDSCSSKHCSVNQKFSVIRE